MCVCVCMRWVNPVLVVDWHSLSELVVFAVCDVAQNVLTLHGVNGVNYRYFSSASPPRSVFCFRTAQCHAQPHSFKEFRGDGTAVDEPDRRPSSTNLRSFLDRCICIINKKQAHRRPVLWPIEQARSLSASSDLHQQPHRLVEKIDFLSCVTAYHHPSRIADLCRRQPSPSPCPSSCPMLRSLCFCCQGTELRASHRCHHFQVQAGSCAAAGAAVQAGRQQWWSFPA